MPDSALTAPRLVLQSTARRSHVDSTRLFDLWNLLQSSSVDAATAENPSVFDFQHRCLYFATIHDPTEEMAKHWQPEKPGKIESIYVPPLKYTPRPLGAGPSVPFPSNDVWSLEVQGELHETCNGHDMEQPFEGDCSSYPSSSTTEHLSICKPSIDPEEIFETSNAPAISNFIGLIYLLDLPHAPREASLGLVLTPSARKKGFGSAAAIQVLEIAFDTFDFHRVNAFVLDGPCRENALRMFVGLGFALEGFRRRAVMSPGDATWKDVHSLGMLDTDWVAGALDRKRGLRAQTRWDEMLARHQREREELVGAEERDSALKRSASTETLRPAQCDLAADSGAESASDAETRSDLGRSASPNSCFEERGAVNPFLDSAAPAPPCSVYESDRFGAGHAYREAESDAESDVYDGIETVTSRVVRATFGASNHERDALNSRPSLDALSADYLPLPSRSTRLPPPSDSESEADVSEDSESGYYSSAMESDGEELPLASNGSRVAVGLPSTSRISASLNAPRPSELQRPTPVMSTSYSIPTVPRDRQTGRPVLPLSVGIMTVVSLGEVCMREHFHTERYIFPVGYEATRLYLSTRDPDTEVVYHCTILDGGDGPKFRVLAADMPDKPIVASTATGAWSGIVRAANLIRKRQHSNSASGPDYFGLGQNTIKHLIQELPGADRLKNYVWQNFVEGGRHAAVIPALPEEHDTPQPLEGYYASECERERDKERDLAALAAGLNLSVTPAPMHAGVDEHGECADRSQVHTPHPEHPPLHRASSPSPSPQTQTQTQTTQRPGALPTLASPAPGAPAHRGADARETFRREGARPYAGLPSPSAPKKRRLARAVSGGGAGSVGVVAPAAIGPASAEMPGPQLVPGPSAGPSTVLHRAQPPADLDTRPNTADSVSSESDMDSETTWDVVSGASLSEFGSPRSTSSLSLQSASDSD